ncbi:MAG: hypothetical protein LBD76_08505 [Prevotellaceae bacterium]|nr:hypothetical protein [Prevotellaceae bacterium]
MDTKKREFREKLNGQKNFFSAELTGLAGFGMRDLARIRLRPVLRIQPK